MNITNMLQKGLMSLTFLLIPIYFTKQFGFDKSELYMVYLPAMILGIFAMGFGAVFGQKKGKSKEILLLGIILFSIAYLVMGIANSSTIFIIGVVIFFIGFNMHEPIMQSSTTVFAKANQRGKVLGIFNTFGYLGTFIGGIFGGILLKYFEISFISIIITFISIFWFILLFKLDNPSIYKNIYLDLSIINKNKIENLKELNGILEYYINKNENSLIIKYNTEKIAEDNIKKIL
jgi:MFS family permease